MLRYPDFAQRAGNTEAVKPLEQKSEHSGPAFDNTNLVVVPVHDAGCQGQDAQSAMIASVGAVGKLHQLERRQGEGDTVRDRKRGDRLD